MTFPKSSCRWNSSRFHQMSRACHAAHCPPPKESSPCEGLALRCAASNHTGRKSKIRWIYWKGKDNQDGWGTDGAVPLAARHSWRRTGHNLWGGLSSSSSGACDGDKHGIKSRFPWACARRAVTRRPPGLPTGRGFLQGRLLRPWLWWPFAVLFTWLELTPLIKASTPATSTLDDKCCLRLNK